MPGSVPSRSASSLKTSCIPATTWRQQRVGWMLPVAEAGAVAQAAIAPSVVQLRARQGQLAGQLQSMLGRLGPSHPDVQSLRAQLAEVDRSVAAEVAHAVAAIAADVRADRERVAALEQDLHEVQGQLDRDSQAQIPLNALQRDAEASRGLLQSVLERIQQTAQQSAIETPDAHEISLALPPGRPSFPRTGPLMAAAAAFGIVFGLLLVYLFELADRSFHSGDDVRTVLGLPCLALIPRVRAARAGAYEHRRVCRPQAAIGARRAAALTAGGSVALAGQTAHRRGNGGAARGRQDHGHARAGASRGDERRAGHRAGLRHPPVFARPGDAGRPVSRPCRLPAGASLARRCHRQGQRPPAWTTSLAARAKPMRLAC